MFVYSLSITKYIIILSLFHKYQVFSEEVPCTKLYVFFCDAFSIKILFGNRGPVSNRLTNNRHLLSSVSDIFTIFSVIKNLRVVNYMKLLL